MELKTVLRDYRKSNNLSVRKFAEMLGVSAFRLEKWEQGSHPNYDDLVKIKLFFRISDIQNISEDFLKAFKPSASLDNTYEVIKLKDMLLEEKDKRIQYLEETVNFLRAQLLKSHVENKVSKKVSKSYELTSPKLQLQ